jgi:large-conductance mechanosensitive channel
MASISITISMYQCNNGAQYRNNSASMAVSIIIIMAIISIMKASISIIIMYIINICNGVMAYQSIEK